MLYDLTLDNIDRHIEDKKKTIAGARLALATAATSDEWKFNKTDSLAYSVQQIAKYEAELEILETLEHYIEIYRNPDREVTLTQLYAELLDTFVLSGPDDGWSGRGNDLRRAIFDAKREMLRALKYVLKD